MGNSNVPRAVALGLLISLGGCNPVENDGQSVAENEAATNEGAPQETDAAWKALRRQISSPLLAITDEGVRNAAAQLLAQNDALVLRTDTEGHVHYLRGPRIGAFRASPATSLDAAAEAARGFIQRHYQVFGLSDATRARCEFSREDGRATPQGLRVMLRQRCMGLPVFGGKLTFHFDERGQLVSVQGRLQETVPQETVLQETVLQETVPQGLAADSSRDKATQDALRHLAKSDVPEHTLASARVNSRAGLLGSPSTLAYQVTVESTVAPLVDHQLLVSAQGVILDDEDRVALAVERVPVRHYTHTDGKPEGGGNRVDTINVNVEERSDGDCTYRLQRFGSGRTRLWNGKNESSASSPRFGRNQTVKTCGSGPDLGRWKKKPEDLSGDPNWLFNAQQTYYWAQWLKTYVDDWGRWSSYPPRTDREVEVEVVVNGRASREEDWCNFSTSCGSSCVMHGCFRSGAPSSWFPGSGLSGNVPAVFLFNSSGNSSSPNFRGSKYSPEYAVIAHEVGHFINWTYGDWTSGRSNQNRSFREGFAMVIPALFGLDRWSNMGYGNSARVSTGSIRTRADGSGSGQWRHHRSGTTAEKHSSISCGANQYKLAWPFVQAMWHLAANRAEDGTSLWTNDQAAIDNTAELILYSMSNHTGTSGMTWDTIAAEMYGFLFVKAWYFNPDGFPDDTSQFLDKVRAIFDTHGLLDPCI